MAPYDSEAQRKFFHTSTARKKGITPAMTKEWDSSSKGMKLRDHAKKAKKSSTNAHRRNQV